MNTTSMVLTPGEILFDDFDILPGRRTDAADGEFVNNENSIRWSYRSSLRNSSFRVKCSAAYECS